MGRASKLTPELQEKIVAFLRRGAYIETAAACCGVHKDTFYEWMKRGAKGEEPHASFADAVTRALAESEFHDLEIIGAAANSVWQAAAWRLERRFPDRYGKNDRVRVDAKIEAGGAELVDKLARLIDGDAGQEQKKRGRPRKDA
jgi:transposase